MKEKKNNLWVKIIAVLVAVAITAVIVLSDMKKETADVNATEPSETETVIIEEFRSEVDTSQPETYSSLLEVLSTLCNKYSTSLKRATLGYTVTGKEIPMVTIGNGQKKALVVGAFHAREHLTTKYLLRCIEDYCYALQSGDGTYGAYDLKSLFSQYTLYIVPCVNPDGLEIVLSRMAPAPGVKIDTLEDYKSNYNGVDLNGNFPLAWEYVDNGVTEPFGHSFKGYSSASENETQALIKLCDEHKFEFLLSVHVKGNFSFWGDMYDDSLNDLYEAFATDIGDATGILPLPEPTQEPSGYGGGFENWFRHTYKKPGLCVELVDVENTIMPCGNENYKEFDNIVIYEKTRYMMAAALASENK